MLSGPARPPMPQQALLPGTNICLALTCQSQYPMCTKSDMSITIIYVLIVISNAMVLLIGFTCLSSLDHFLSLLILCALRARITVLVDDLLVDILLELINLCLVELACADLALEKDVHLGKGAACWLGEVEVRVNNAAEANTGL